MTRGFKISLVALLLASASAAHAVPISGSSGTGGIGSFTGDISYSFASDTQGTLTVSLTNTSAFGDGGYLTAFVLNNPDDLIASILLSSAAPNFALMGLGDNSISASPFGDFDFGASATGGQFLGGGSPTGGLAFGASGTFVFDLTGTDLDTLSVGSFLTELSNDPGGGGAQSFVVRIRGFDPDGSDKIPFDTPGEVPEPGALGLLGLGLLALAARRRRA